MSIEVGSKVSGKISGITNFGAFVDLGDKKTGLVHISEVSDGFVKDIHDVLTVGDTVTVKVLSVGDDGKISLSIRKAQDKPEGNKKDHHRKSEGDRHNDGRSHERGNGNRPMQNRKFPQQSHRQRRTFDIFETQYVRQTWRPRRPSLIKTGSWEKVPFLT